MSIYVNIVIKLKRKSRETRKGKNPYYLSILLQSENEHVNIKTSSV